MFNGFVQICTEVNILEGRKDLTSNTAINTYRTTERFCRKCRAGINILKNNYVLQGEEGVAQRRVPVRVVLGILVFFMFVLTQMIRTNFYLVIIDITTASNKSSPSNDSEKFDWTKPQVGMLMGSFYWCYWLAELPGGILATRFGGKRLLFGSVLLASLLNICVPLACRCHFWAAMLVRLLQGFVLGVSWPCVHALSARWIPLVERSKFTTTYHGSAIGGAINSILSGVLITRFGWQHVFYLTGVLSLLWCFAWMFLVFDSPAQHPGISSKEKNYLLDSVSTTKKKTQDVPWSSILKSGPFWAVLLASQAVVWVTVTVSMQLPAYFSSVHHLDMATNGFVSCLPDICKFIAGTIISTVIDSSVEQKVLSTTAARKLAVTASTLIPGLLLVVLGYCGSNATIAVAILILTSSASGASTSGNLSNIVDISPNYAGILMGLVKTMVVIPGSLSPFIASILVGGDDIVAGWQQLFCLTAVLCALGSSIFLFLGSGKVQPWNDFQQETRNTADAETLMKTKD